MKRVCIPYALFKSIEVEITNDLNLDNLLVKPDNKKYWHYSEIIGEEEYKKIYSCNYIKDIKYQ